MPHVTPESKRVLIVWDSGATARSTIAALESAGLQGRHEPDSFSGLLSVETWRPAIIILDWEQRLISGPTFLAALEAGLPAPPPVVALVERDQAAAVQETLAAAVVTKPPDVSQLVRLVCRMLEG